MKKLLSILLNRIFIVGMLILIQLIFLIEVIWRLSETFVYLYPALILISVAVVVQIVSRTDNPSYKLAWAIPVLAVPLFGWFILSFIWWKEAK